MGRKGYGACTTARQAQAIKGALSWPRCTIPSLLFLQYAEPPPAGAGQARVRAHSAALARGEQEGKEEKGRGFFSTARSSGRRRYVCDSVVVPLSLYAPAVVFWSRN